MTRFLFSLAALAVGLPAVAQDIMKPVVVVGKRDLETAGNVDLQTIEAERVSELLGYVPGLASVASDSAGYGDILAVRGSANTLFFGGAGVAMVVDDVPMNRKICSKILQNLGYAEIQTAENGRLLTQIRSEQQDRDTLFAQALKLTDEMNRLRGFKQQLEQRNKQLMAQVTRFQEVVTAKGIDINEPLDGAPPERNGNILQIDRPTQLVLVSIGYDEGLRKGHFLEVTRGGRYVGKLKVRDTEPDRAVAEILRDYSEGILQEGDRVDTTLD